MMIELLTTKDFFTRHADDIRKGKSDVADIFGADAFEVEERCMMIFGRIICVIEVLQERLVATLLLITEVFAGCLVIAVVDEDATLTGSYSFFHSVCLLVSRMTVNAP